MARVSRRRVRPLPPGVVGSAPHEPAGAALVPVVLFGADDPAGLVPAAPDPTRQEIQLARAVLERWNSARPPKTTRERLADLRLLGSFAWGTDDPALTLARLAVTGYHGARAIVSRWHESMIAAGLADTTRQRRIVSVRGAIGTAAIMGLLKWTLTDVEIPHVKQYGRASGPQWRDVERVLLDLRARGAWRHLALVLLLYDVGLRSREASGLMVNAIDLNAREVSVIRKGRTDPTIVRLTARTCEALRRAIDLRPKEWRTRGPVFTHGFKRPRPWSYTAVRNVTIGLGLGRPHGLRHSLATRIVDLTGGDVRAAQGALGHANVATTQIYIDTSLRSAQAGAMATLDEQIGEGWIDGTSKANEGARERGAKQGGEQAAAWRRAGAQAARSTGGARQGRRSARETDRAAETSGKGSGGARKPAARASRKR